MLFILTQGVEQFLTEINQIHTGTIWFFMILAKSKSIFLVQLILSGWFKIRFSRVSYICIFLCFLSFSNSNIDFPLLCTVQDIHQIRGLLGFYQLFICLNWYLWICFPKIQISTMQHSILFRASHIISYSSLIYIILTTRLYIRITY